jgi:FdhD protein
MAFKIAATTNSILTPDARPLKRMARNKIAVRDGRTGSKRQSGNLASRWGEDRQPIDPGGNCGCHHVQWWHPFRHDGHPQDLEDLAVGFSLTENVVESMEEIESIDIQRVELGIEARLWISPARANRLAVRRRATIGPTGCGVCGIESLAEAVKIPMKIETDVLYSYTEISSAIEQLPAVQCLNSQTRAIHAAAFWRKDTGILLVREDVGRHNALDKLAGALFQAGIKGDKGAVVLTSRVSVEMVQKTAALGTPLIISISAPTASAIRIADKAGITLAAIARSDGFEVFTHSSRVTTGDVTPCDAPPIQNYT